MRIIKLIRISSQPECTACPQRLAHLKIPHCNVRQPHHILRVRARADISGSWTRYQMFGMMTRGRWPHWME